MWPFKSNRRNTTEHLNSDGYSWSVLQTAGNNGSITARLNHTAIEKITYTVTAALLLLSIGVAQAKATEYEPVVAVHPGTELLHIINYLAGVARPRVADYSYRNDVDNWFAKYATHPAVLHAKSLPYNDFVELGWAFDYTPGANGGMQLKKPQGFGWQGKMKTPEYLQTYLELSEDFARQSNFSGFFAAQQSNYALWVAQFEVRLKELAPEAVLWDFFGLSGDAASDNAQTTIYYSISPIGVTLRANIIMHEVRPDQAHFGAVLIPFDPQYLTKEGEKPANYPAPDFHYTDIALQQAVWHEAAHVIYEALAQNHNTELSAITYRDCFSRNLAIFDDSGLNTYFFIHEVVADAVSIFLKSVYVSEAAAEHHLKLNEDMGGMLYRPLVEYFRTSYFPNRHKQNFSAQMPSMIAFINSLEPIESCN